MPTILIASIDAGGNVPPTIGIARELRRRGWRVVVHGDDVLRERVEAADLEFAPVAGPQLDPLRSFASPGAVRDIARVLVDTRRAEEVRRLARDLPADVALVDAALTRAVTACVGLLPVAVLCPTSWEIVGRFAGPPYARLLEALGLPVGRILAAADRILVVSPAVLDRAATLPPNAVRVGAVLQDPPSTPQREAVPLVLVSLSSFYFPRQAHHLEHIAEALAGLGARLVVTSGRTVDPAGLRLPPGTEVHGHLDHGLVLPRASLLVGHGGHATTVRALEHDVPLLVVPLNHGSDQPRLGRAVARAGVGLVVRKSAPIGRIRAAAATVLRQPAFAAAAAAAGAAVRAENGAARAADELELLAAR